VVDLELRRRLLVRQLCGCVLFVSLAVVGNQAFGQQTGRVNSGQAVVQDKTSRSTEVRQELESLRNSYRLRLRELDGQMQELGFEPESSPLVFGHGGQSPEQPATLATFASHARDDYVGKGLFGDRLQVTLGGGGSLKIYGYARGDLIYADSQLSNTVVPFFAVSEDPTNTVGPNSVSVPDNDDQFNVNSRLTRLGLDVSDLQSCFLYDAQLGAKIEIDFETLINIASESRAVPRIRLAYGEMKWDELSLLFGQTWDVISPLNPMINDDSLMWNAGNLGDRRPMLRLKWDRDLGDGTKWVVAGALSSGGAIDRKDLDGNGIRDGEDSGLPAFQARIGHERGSWVPRKNAGLGVWSFVSFESIDAPIMGNDEFTGWGVGIDWTVPLWNTATWRGEIWHGRNLSDWRGGSAQGVNTTTGQEIESSGGWTEVQFALGEYYTLALGMTGDNPLDTDLIGNATSRTLNWTWYVGNRLSMGGGLSLRVNAEFWNTEYLTLSGGDAMRLNDRFDTALLIRHHPRHTFLIRNLGYPMRDKFRVSVDPGR